MTTNKLDGLYCILPLNRQKMMLIIVHCCVESTLISFACMWQRHPVNLFPFKAAKALNLFTSPKQVTKHLMIMYTRCLRQNYSYIDKLRKTRLAGSAITQSKEVIILNVLRFWCIVQYPSMAGAFDRCRYIQFQTDFWLLKLVAHALFSCAFTSCVLAA